MSDDGQIDGSKGTREGLGTTTVDAPAAGPGSAGRRPGRSGASPGGEGARPEGTGTRSEGTGSGPGAKILPFPRDWFGPVEDLVPVFPEPAAPVASEPAAAAAREPAAPSPRDSAATVVSAASFWDEDAGALHQVVESLDKRWVGESDQPLEPLEPVHPPVVQRAAADTPRLVGHPARSAPAGEPPVPPVPLSLGGEPGERSARVLRARAILRVMSALGVFVITLAVALVMLTGAVRDPSSRPARQGEVHSVAAANVAIGRSKRLAQGEPKHHAAVERKRSADRTGSQLGSSRSSRRRRRGGPRVHHSAASVTPTATHSEGVSTQGASAAQPASASSAGCVESPDSGCMP